MRNIMFLAGITVAIIAISVGISQSQQESGRSPDQALLQMSDRVDRVEQAQKSILQKLDTVLANQQKILSELDIIKVRATRR